MIDIRDRARQVADEHGNDAYSVALAMLEEIELLNRVKTIFSETEEVDYALTDAELSKIKAEAAQEALTNADIPSGSKAGCIGEFSVRVENGGVCPECYLHGDEEDCEICQGESENGLYDVSYDIPWTTQKEIFKRFCKYAALDQANKLEQGRCMKSPYDKSNLIKRSAALLRAKPLNELRELCENQKTVSTSRLMKMLDDVEGEMRMDGIRLGEVAKRLPDY